MAPGRKRFFSRWGDPPTLNCPEAFEDDPQWLGLESGSQLPLCRLWNSKWVPGLSEHPCPRLQRGNDDHIGSFW